MIVKWRVDKKYYVLHRYNRRVGELESFSLRVKETLTMLIAKKKNGSTYRFLDSNITFDKVSFNLTDTFN